MNLYEDLGVDKNADSVEIKKAYRDKAKSSHPDAGGSREQWEKVNNAYLVLSDKDKRSKYDRTGEFPSDSVDTTLSRRFQIIAYLFNQLIEEETPLYINWFEAIKQALNSKIRDAKDSIEFINDEILKIEKIRKHIKRRPNAKNIDFLNSMIDKKVVDQKEKIEEFNQRIEDGEACIILLDEYEFEPEEAPNIDDEPNPWGMPKHEHDKMREEMIKALKGKFSNTFKKG